jgi:hypothetical protein
VSFVGLRLSVLCRKEGEEEQGGGDLVCFDGLVVLVKKECLVLVCLMNAE